MNLARHCRLCDHLKTSFKLGTICGLTDGKPKFNKTCSKIELNEKLEDQLIIANIEYDKVKRTKHLTHINFVLYAVIGVTVIIGGFLLGKYALDGGVISSVPIIIMVVGLKPLGMAIGILNNYRQKSEMAETKKNKIDEVLNEYQMDYDIHIKYGKIIHGTQEVTTELQINSLKKKTTTHKIMSDQ